MYKLFLQLSFLTSLSFIGNLSLPLSAQTKSLIVRTDLESRLSINGKPHSHLKPDKEARIALPPGEYQIEAAPLSGTAKWQSIVELDSSSDKVINIPLQATVLRSDIQEKGYWKDLNTQLIWAAADNGFAVSWIQADLYCRKLVIGSLKNWSLPAIDDLRQIFGGAENDRGYRIISPLKLTGWAWSATEGNEPGEYWSLDFGDGARASVISGDSGLNRALCVHRPQ